MQINYKNYENRMKFKNSDSNSKILHNERILYVTPSFYK